MIGQVIEERGRFPYAATFCLLVAAGCAAAAVATHQWNWGVFAVLPGAVGVVLPIARETPFSAELTPTGLQTSGGQLIVPYSDMLQIVFAGAKIKCDRGLVHVVHSSGEFVIPERLCTATIDVYRFLVAKMPPKSRTISEQQFDGHYREQVTTFGESKVWAHQARPEIKLEQPKWGRFVGPAMLLSAIAWFAASVKEPLWVVMAIALLVVTPIVWVSGYRKPKSRPLLNDNSQLTGFLLAGVAGAVIMSNRQARNSKQLSEACLIISPSGLALSQGDLHGHMRWSELKKIRLYKGSPLSTPRIDIRVEGASLKILDVYDTPLPDIHQQIENYWKAG